MLALGLCVLGHGASAQPGTIVPVGPDNLISAALDINDRGQVVGTYLRADGAAVPFVWERGVLTPLYAASIDSFTPNGAYCINNSGLIGGVADGVAAVWVTPSSYASLQANGQEFFGVVQALKDSPSIEAVGWTEQAFRSTGVVTSALADLGFGSRAMAINRSGLAVGYLGRLTGQTVADAACMWSPTTGLQVVGPVGVVSRANGVNDRGMMSGKIGNRAAVWVNGEALEIGPDCPAGAEAFDVNIREQIVGAIDCPFGGFDVGGAFLSVEGRVTNLNRFAPGTGWILDAAYAINGQDQIAGVGRLNGRRRAFMLSLCRADYNGDGVVNIQDFLSYLAAFSAGTPRSDFNGDGAVNIQDLLAYLAQFSLGC
jgi:hypothetical protein